MLAYSGRGHFVIERIYVEELVTGIAQLLKNAMSRRIRLIFRLEPVPSQFHGEVAQLHQVVMNLITNAAEAIGDRSGDVMITTGTMECSRAHISTSNTSLLNSYASPLAEGPNVYVHVSDNGCSMDTQTVHQLFDAVFTTKFIGRGIGMSTGARCTSRSSWTDSRGHRGRVGLDVLGAVSRREETSNRSDRFR
jgi:two-component system cell cycle sensor histidine kinase/response regulator CckA